MIAVALRSMGQRKLRSVLTSIAILLGVAMIAGTYVQTDQIRAAFDDILQTANAGVDANITPRTEFRSDFGAAQTMDEALVARASRIPGVAPRASCSRPARWSSTARRSSRTSRPRSSCR
jgi:putative ABC transport system permease protein